MLLPPGLSSGPATSLLHGDGSPILRIGIDRGKGITLAPHIVPSQQVLLKGGASALSLPLQPRQLVVALAAPNVPVVVPPALQRLGPLRSPPDDPL